MRLKFPVKRIVKKHEQEIIDWRSEGAPWCEVAAALMVLHPGTDLQQDSIRKAWLSLCPKNLKNSEDKNRELKKDSDKQPSTPMAFESAVNDCKNIKSEEILRKPKTISDNKLPAFVVPPSEPIAEHVQMQKMWEATQAENKREAFSTMYKD